MGKIYCATGLKEHPAYSHRGGIGGRELNMECDRSFSQAEIEQIDKAITSLSQVVANVYRINGVDEAAEEFQN